MHVDAMTIPQPLGRIGDLARRTQSVGFSGLLFTETGRTAYLNAAVASQAAPGLELSTGVAVAFLDTLIEAAPYKVHTVLTDNGIQFADLPKNRQGPTARFRGHPFDRLCFVHGIEHRLTKPNHPWTNGQVERMNRTIKDATVKRYFYDTHNQLKEHLNDFLRAYNFARRLKTLKGLTPYEYLCKLWTQTPDRFTLNPIHQMPGLNT